LRRCCRSSAAAGGAGGPSFFLTGFGDPAEGGEALDQAESAAAEAEEASEWERLADELVSTEVQNMDMRTAVTALKELLERPNADPLPASTSYLKGTAATRAGYRTKHVLPPAPRPRGLGLRPLVSERREGGAAEGMNDTLTKLQQRLGELEGVDAAEASAGDDPGALMNALTAMGEMHLGGGAAPAPLA